MREELNSLKIKVLEDIEKMNDIKGLEDLRVRVFGKKGELTSILKDMGKLSAEERPQMGKLANEIKEELETSLKDKTEKINKAELEKRILAETLDVTADLKETKIGHRHPLNQTIEELELMFREMGFDVVDGPEIELVENNFSLLNFPDDHPSIGPSDTFYIDEDHLLRTHTSPVQVRYMKKFEPPIRMVSAGRTFRVDDVDDTHSPMFHQIECLVVDEGVTMANLIETLDAFVKNFFGADIKTRFRPHNFPFTEPSAEVDISCMKCRGEGCQVCSFTGWDMELLGCGMVHPNVLSACGIDPEKYSGFAFGMGIDRITMVKYGLDNIRLLYENDARFLKQF